MKKTKKIEPQTTEAYKPVKKYRVELIETGDGWETREQSALNRALGFGFRSERKTEQLVCSIDGELLHDFIMSQAEKEKEIERLKTVISEYKAAQEKIMNEGK